MNLMALDLEFAQPCGTIIQVGIAIGDIKTGEILYTGQWDIKSDTQVSEYITNLTGITQADIDKGIPLQVAYDHMVLMHMQYECIMNPLTWGGGDSETLRKQLGMDEGRWRFGRRWIDAKTLFIARQMARGQPYIGGLSRSMKKMGLKFEGEAHRASTDAENTFRMYHKLLGEFK